MLVSYTLTAQDERTATIRRVARTRTSTFNRGTAARAGQVRPMLITNTTAEGVSGQVFLDSFDQLWVTATEGEGPGHYRVPQ
jgi:hypothetical protein